MTLTDEHNLVVSGTTLTQMLDSVANGLNISPRQPSRCIILDIDDDLTPASVDSYAARIVGFSEFLTDYYLRSFSFAGVERHCIRVYMEPRRYSQGVRNDIAQKLDVLLFQKQMARYDIKRLFIYGKTLVVNR